MGNFHSVFERNQYDLQSAIKKSQTWFQQQANMLAAQNITPLGMINSRGGGVSSSRLVPGELIMFAYDALHRDTLPHYDMFPMVFPFRKMPDGFIGLNLHYVPYKARVVLLDHLMEYKTSNTLTEDTRLQFSWKLISKTAQHPLYKACVHRYLFKQVQSKFKRIEAQYWTTALMLPVERFVGAPKQRVWGSVQGASR
jgi:hypothetical protein